MTWTPLAVPDHNGDVVYRVEDQGKCTIVPLPRDAVLAVQIDADGFKVDFAVFEFGSSETDGKNTLHKMVMHGQGYSSALRECRHTYWGEPDNQGYIFYPDFDVITAALAALKTWFDGT